MEPNKPTSTTTNKTRPRFPAWLMALLLVSTTVAVYWPATRCDFINLDDDFYVTANVHVRNGFTLEDFKWAWSTPVVSNWHPLTMLSHMLDCQIYGLKPWGHHLTSLLLHATNTALVFVLFRRLAGALWRSALVAALFGWHPVHVESVVWVAERKDVLSGFFGLLSLIFYARYARQGRGQEPEVRGQWSGLALIFLALGLMSKAMLVTWPFVMLVLDYWPLNRVRNAECRARNAKMPTDQVRNFKTLVVEKIPFFALAVVASVVTFVVQKQTGAIGTFETFPLGARCENALISYCRYLGKLFWPSDCAFFYPYPRYWPWEEVLLASAFLAGVTLMFWIKRREHPYWLTGWLWYCGTLLPVIGLVQVGRQAMADRYTYLPSLGALFLLVWGLSDLLQRRRYQVITLSLAGCVALVMCLGMTRQQIGYWRDSETLFRHAIAVTRDNAPAYNGLGLALAMKGRTGDAMVQFQEALRLNPDFALAHNNLGSALGNQRPDGGGDQLI